MKNLIKIKKSGKQPLIMCHAIGGTVVFYNRLAFQLENSISLYGIQAYGVDEESEPLNNIKVIAERYYLELKKEFDLSKVRLGGYSFGCLIVLEIIKLAESDEINVQKAILISPPTYKKYEVESANSRERLISEESNKYLKQFFKGMDKLLPSSVRNKYLSLYASHLTAYYEYDFGTKIKSPLKIICPIEPVTLTSSWHNVSDSVIDIDCLNVSHRTILRNPGVKSVARAINLSLQ